MKIEIDWNIIVKWYYRIQHDKQKKYTLRRCKNINEIYLQPAYIDLLNKMGFSIENAKKNNFALIAGILVHIKNRKETKEEEKEDKEVIEERPAIFYKYKFADQMSRFKNDSPIINIKNFQRLIACNDEDKFFKNLIKIVKIIDFFDIKEFSKDLFFWNSTTRNKIKKKWAEVYYSNLPEKFLEKF